MIFLASSDCLQRAGWGAATLKLADFIFIGLKDMLRLFFSKCDRKKPMSFRSIFPSTSCRFFFRTDASALPYVCAGSQGHRCGLSFRQGDDGAVGVPLRSPVFRGCLWRVWSPCTPPLSRTCPRSFVGLVVLRR